MTPDRASGLRVGPTLTVPAAALGVRFVRSSGPGGQNVNKVATKCELRLALDETSGLAPGVRTRLAARYPAHVTTAGDFVLTSDRFRSQARNRADTEERLVEMILVVLVPPRPRRKTGVPRGAKRRRLEAKRRQSERKKLRRAPERD